MKGTVKELIETLYEYPPEAEIRIEDLKYDQEFSIVSFYPGDNILTIVITDEDIIEDEPE